MADRKRLIGRICCLLLLLGLFILPPVTASAQNLGMGQAVSLTKSALEDYDFFELESADNKIMQAVQIIETRGTTDKGAANIYIAQGIISYGRYKDTAPAIAEDRAYSAFVKALALNSAAVIPGDYRSAEITEIFERARKDIASAPAPAAQVQPVEPPPAPQPQVVPPKIDHNTIVSSNRCVSYDVSATVPAHPDIYRVYLYYASDDKPGYDSVEMIPSFESADVLKASIPSSVTQGERVHYYIEAVNRQNEVVANVANALTPLSTIMMGECSLPSTFDDTSSSSKYGDPIFQFSLMVGSAFGVVGDKTENCDGNAKCMPNGGSVSSISTGVAPLPFHLRSSAIFDLPKHFQIGIYVRGQLANIVKTTLTPNAKANVKRPEQYNVMVGLALRYLAIWEQPYRLYLGVELGWGGANATVDMGSSFNNFKDIYLYKGPFHVAPEIGFLWSFHKNAGLAIELAVPIVFPERPSVFFDLSIGPYFQF
ncbi:MAG: hypothetical protein II180_00155 [Proteobacteria bacterium]|nr:hypothetical protein [Pseudomonadota bacterium]